MTQKRRAISAGGIPVVTSERPMLCGYACGWLVGPKGVARPMAGPASLVDPVFMAVMGPRTCEAPQGGESVRVRLSLPLARL